MRIWAVIGVLVAATIVTVFSCRLVWFRAYGVSITYDGNPAPDARAYRHQGEIFLDLGRQSATPYIIRLKDNAVGIPGNSFVAITGFLAVAKNDPVLIVDMRSAKNNNRDPKLVVIKASATFIDNVGQTVRLNW
jgi:hypothetical protein